jgi:hypothetical protein
VSPIFVEAIQQRGVLFSGGFHLPSFDEQDQFSLPVFLGTLDPNAATVFARFRHFEIPQPDEEKTKPTSAHAQVAFCCCTWRGATAKLLTHTDSFGPGFSMPTIPMQIPDINRSKSFMSAPNIGLCSQL